MSSGQHLESEPLETHGTPCTTINRTKLSSKIASIIMRAALLMVDGDFDNDSTYSFYDEDYGTTFSGDLSDELSSSAWKAMKYLYNGATSGDLTGPSNFFRVYGEDKTSRRASNDDGVADFERQDMFYCPDAGGISLTKADDGTIVDSDGNVIVSGVSYDPGEVVMYITTSEGAEASADISRLGSFH